MLLNLKGSTELLQTLYIYIFFTSVFLHFCSVVSVLSKEDGRSNKSKKRYGYSSTVPNSEDREDCTTMLHRSHLTATTTTATTTTFLFVLSVWFGEIMVAIVERGNCIFSRREKKCPSGWWHRRPEQKEVKRPEATDCIKQGFPMNNRKTKTIITNTHLVHFTFDNNNNNNHLNRKSPNMWFCHMNLYQTGGNCSVAKIVVSYLWWSMNNRVEVEMKKVNMKKRTKEQKKNRGGVVWRVMRQGNI